MSESQNFEESILTLLPPEDVNYDSKQFEDLHDGYLFGKYKNYRLKAKLGEGGMGQTWLAEELVENEVSQRVVLKILTQELRGNADALKEVRRVFDLTKNLNHSSICPLLGRYVDPNFGDFLVMKYADGGTLADWFEKQPGHENGLPLETLLPIFRPLAEALDLAHRNGILHRDVKPQNIMFMGKTPVLIDFGIAARIRPENVTSNTQSFSRTDTMASSTSGTPRYMAPEQMEGKSQNSRTDQYALATVLYEMLTGSLPFSGGVVSIVLQKSRFDPQLPQFAPHVNAALARALSFNAADRFSTCAEFIDALTTPLSEPAPKSVPKLDVQAQKKEGRLEQHGNRAAIFSRRNFILGGLGAAAALGVWRMTQDTEEPLNNYSPVPLDPSENGILGTFPFGTAAGERKVWQVDGIYYAFRWCPAGTFTMGSPSSEPDRWGCETQHRVTLTRGFWMLETEVTEEMWHHVMSARVATQAAKEIGPVAAPSWKKGPDHPKVEVHWMECDEFCRKLSSQLGLTVSLPTEAQWEYACRAGTTGAYAGDLGEVGWHVSNSGDETHPVGQKKPNAWGLYDMHGNVHEWCQDRYDEDYYTESPTSDPCNEDSGSYRVSRGGGWSDFAQFCRSAFRNKYAPDVRVSDLGFRPVLPVQSRRNRV